MALQRIFGAALDDRFGELRREKSFQTRQPLELRHLVLHALLERRVQVLELVVVLLDPQQRPYAGQQLGLFAPQLARAARLDWQLIGLALRFGSDRLLRARLLDPESALVEARSELFPAGSA